MVFSSLYVSVWQHIWLYFVLLCECFSYVFNCLSFLCSHEPFSIFLSYSLACGAVDNDTISPQGHEKGLIISYLNLKYIHIHIFMSLKKTRIILPPVVPLSICTNNFFAWILKERNESWMLTLTTMAPVGRCPLLSYSNFELLTHWVTWEAFITTKVKLAIPYILNPLKYAWQVFNDVIMFTGRAYLLYEKNMKAFKTL